MFVKVNGRARQKEAGLLYVICLDMEAFCVVPDVPGHLFLSQLKARDTI